MNCPYCKSNVKLIDSIEIYKYRSYGPAYACERFPECDSYVGVHPGTINPLGRLADKELRNLKMQTHRVFDAIWKMKMATESCSKKEARDYAYKWLANQLSIKKSKCHIAIFDKEMCDKAISVCGLWKSRSRIAKAVST